MFKKEEYIVYKRDVCKIIEIKQKYMNDEDYYILSPILDESLKISVPVSNEKNYLRNLISKEELAELIEIVPQIKVLTENDKQIENEYKALMKSNKYEDLIKIIKTSYLRNKDRLDNKKKISDKDDRYFKQAEQYLYTEFSIVLNKSIDETRQYVIDEIAKLAKE